MSAPMASADDSRVGSRPAGMEEPVLAPDWQQLAGQRPRRGRRPEHQSDFRLLGHLQRVINLDSQVRTVLSSLVRPRSNWTARRFFVRR